MSAANLASVALLVLLPLASAASADPPGSNEAAAEPERDVGLATVRELVRTGDYERAESVARELLVAVEAKHGADASETADVLDALVEAMWHRPRAPDPTDRALAERAVAIRERTSGSGSRACADSLGNLGLLLQATGESTAAIPVLERRLGIVERLGPEHEPAVTSALNDLAVAHARRGDYAAARPLFERVVAIDEQRHGTASRKVLNEIHNLATLHEAMGDYDAAKRQHERCLTLREQAFGPESLDVASSAHNLGLTLVQAGGFEEARRLTERALAIRTKVLGAENPETVACVDQLARIHHDMGDAAGARALFESGVRIREKVLGSAHPDLAVSLGNLGISLMDTGDFTSAKGVIERSLSIEETAFGSESPSLTSGLINLAMVLEATGDLAAARAVAERALRIAEHGLGADHPETATILVNLGALRLVQGETEVAAALLDRAVKIRETVLGSEHPAVAEALVNAALIAEERADPRSAVSLLQRAAAISEKSKGPEHPDVAAALSPLARLLARTGDRTRAFEAALRAESVGRSHLILTARALSERQTLRYAAHRPRGLDVALSLAAENVTDAMRADAWDALIRSRAVVLDEMGHRHRMAAVDSPSKPLAEELVLATRRLATLIVRGPGDLPPERYRQLVDDAQARKEAAERILADSSASFRTEQASSRRGFRDVAAEVSPHEALIGFARYSRLPVGKPSASEPAVGPDADSVACYLAFVLRGDTKQCSVVPLGPAGDLDDLVMRWRAAAGPGGDAQSEREVGEALRRATWDPLLAALGPARRVFIVPDGTLHLVSFAALPVGEIEWLAETGPTLHHLSAERDVVTSAEPTREGQGLLVVGAPAFDETSLFASLATTPASRPSRMAGLVSALATLLPFRGATSTCAAFTSLRFTPLPGTEREATEVASSWAKRQRSTVPSASAVHLSGPAASEAAFKEGASGKKVLHLATHGYFLPSACEVGKIGTGANLRPIASDVAGVGESPLVMSGLALAGANRRDAAGPDEEDGVLTAEEVAALDLRGLEWAVLSACDTGLGDIRAGEGVFGLRRAFQVAGARTVIMSLWAVDDEATREWMSALYEARLVEGQDTSESVRQASLSVLRSRRTRGLSTPASTWAGFIATGDWR